MVVWETPPPSNRSSAEYRLASLAVHTNPGRWARVFHEEIHTVDEKSLIRVKWAQAMQRRCRHCQVKAVSSEDDMFSIFVIHDEHAE